MDILKIMDILPHRYPFLLVDSVVETADTYVVAKKNVTANEPMFTGHFPENPIFPGVLIAEAMAQAAGLLVYHRNPYNKNEKVTLFMGIENFKFRKPVVPGDTMLLRIELIQEREMGKGHIVRVKGEARVGDELRANGELSLGIFNK